MRWWISAPVVCAQPERDDRQPRDVVGAVARRALRHAAVGVLDDPDVVDQRQQVRERARAASVAGGAMRERRSRGPSATASRSTVGGLPADLGPRQLAGRRRTRLGARPLEPLRIVEQPVDRRRRARPDRRTARAPRRPRRAGPPRSSTASTPSGSRRRSRTSARPTRSARATGTASGRSSSPRASTTGRRGSRKRSSKTTWSARPRSRASRSSEIRYSSPWCLATSGWVWPAIT